MNKKDFLQNVSINSLSIPNDISKITSPQYYAINAFSKSFIKCIEILTYCNTYSYIDLKYQTDNLLISLLVVNSVFRIGKG